MAEKMLQMLQEEKSELEMTSQSFNKMEAVVVTLSQLGFSLVGTFFNNLVLLAVKDPPGIRASMYHLLLANLTLTNLLICSIVKPITGIYIGYSLSTEEVEIGLEFCSVYTVISWALPVILPATILVLAWHVFLAGRRAEERGLGVPSHVFSIFTMMVPLARAVVDGGPDPDNSFDDLTYDGKQTREHKRKMLKAVTMEEGPRPRQAVLLGMMWVTAGLVGITRYADPEGQIERRPWSKEFIVRPASNSSKEITVTRDVDIVFCQVWKDPGILDHLLWLFLVPFPVLAGPIIAGCFEFGYQIRRYFSKPPMAPIPSRKKYWMLLGFLSTTVFVCYSTNIILAESVFPKYFQLSYFHLLLTKYILGWCETIISPILVILVDKDIRESIVYLYRQRRFGRTKTSTMSTISYI